MSHRHLSETDLDPLDEDPKAVAPHRDEVHEVPCRRWSSALMEASLDFVASQGGRSSIVIFPASFYHLFRKAQVESDQDADEEGEHHQKKGRNARSEPGSPRCLQRLAHCLETLFERGLREADFWIIPVCKRSIWLCFALDITAKCLTVIEPTTKHRTTASSIRMMLHFASAVRENALQDDQQPLKKPDRAEEDSWKVEGAFPLRLAFEDMVSMTPEMQLITATAQWLQEHYPDDVSDASMAGINEKLLRDYLSKQIKADDEEGKDKGGKSTN